MNVQMRQPCATISRDTRGTKPTTARIEEEKMVTQAPETKGIEMPNVLVMVEVVEVFFSCHGRGRMKRGRRGAK